MYSTRVGQTPDAILASAQADRNAIAAEYPPPGVLARQEIMTWQGKLYSLGFLQRLSNGVAMTGFEGPRTRAATRAFEQAAGGAIALRANGIYKPSYDAIADTKLRTGSYPPPQGLPVLPGSTLGGGGGFIQFPGPATQMPPATQTPPLATPPPVGSPLPVGTPPPAAPAAGAMSVPIILGIGLVVGLAGAALLFNRR